jgi:hypothetical protein
VAWGGPAGQGRERSGIVDFSVGRCVRGRWPVAEWALGRFDLFLLLTSFPINSKVPVSKIQIIILLNSNTFQIWQVDR